jgi:hypothetical protein
MSWIGRIQALRANMSLWWGTITIDQTAMTVPLLPSMEKYLDHQILLTGVTGSSFTSATI